MARYTLAQLEELTRQALQSGTVNNMVDGYPLLHSILIELRDEKNPNNRPKYIHLIRTLLADQRTDVNVLDKHGSTPLMEAASEIRSLKLVKLFMERGANPNYVGNIDRWTALEKTIFRSPESTSIIDYLKTVTTITPRIQEFLQDLLRRGIEEEDIQWINAIMRLGFIRYENMASVSCPAELLAEFNSGFWIRTISDVNSEVGILRKREKIAEDQFQGYQSDEEDEDYTRYSAATFVKNPIPIGVFNSSDPGIMFRQRNRTIAYWYDGHREELTRDWHFHRSSKLGHGIKGEYQHIIEGHIGEKLVIRYQDMLAKIQKSQKDGQLDTYGVLADQQVRSIDFSWNEGLLRYKKEDIFGFYVNPDNQDSIAKAFALRRMLNLGDIHFYYYDPHKGIKRVSAKKLTAKHEPPIPYGKVAEATAVIKPSRKIYEKPSSLQSSTPLSSAPAPSASFWYHAKCDTHSVSYEGVRRDTQIEAERDLQQHCIDGHEGKKAGVIVVDPRV